MDDKKIELMAMDLFSWMAHIKPPKGNWHVYPHRFLPDDVVIDNKQHKKFIKGMEKIIKDNIKMWNNS